MMEFDDFLTRDIELKDDYEGHAKAVLVHYTPSSSHEKAVLYVHGFADYFFQKHLAHFYNDEGYAFYALDLRKHGRSMMDHQRPNFARSITEYYEELGKAVEIIRSEHNYLLLNGHSTGGLITPLFVAEDPKGKLVDALFLNSPFFAFPYPNWMKRMLLPAIINTGKFFPYKQLPAKFSKCYGQSINKAHHGEWEYDTSLKPIEGFNVYFGWVYGVYRAQKRLRRGLHLNIPVFVIHSDHSIFKITGWSKELQQADAVLNVNDIRKHSEKIGENVKRVEIENAMHDVFLSPPDIRQKAFEELHHWLHDLEVDREWNEG
ncbi:alpha/beta hydrolase [Salibacter sp.]|uniref:alpha/beta hydrolase n=1 Tax=Salibacter sp. TaxID=2010995 RepID=UPI0028705342|nr:alpha/beta hydrolase [Salibacter sp.]MDR9398181.1 alpha/beta hydrolase [Salibacter sp.]MDR9487040.1 alpha/beta hydrolase [Salibacter sp.]